MSDAGDSAHVHILLADYAVSAGGKLTIVGGGLTVVGLLPTGLTAPFFVAATTTFDPRFVGERPAVELVLEDQDGQPVAVPGAVGQLGQPQYIRVALSNQLQQSQFKNWHVPTEATRPTVQIVLNFQTGLPLKSGQRYTWRVKIDQETRDEWTTWLYVPGPPQLPVVG